MSKTLNTRDALLALREVVNTDTAKAERIEGLLGLLNEAVQERVRTVDAALSQLENYVEVQAKLHGFSIDVDRILVASTSDDPAEKMANTRRVAKKKASKKKTKRRTKRKKKSTKKVAKKQSRGSTGTVTSYPGTIDSTIFFSAVEKRFVDLLRAQWPEFVTVEQLSELGILKQNNHVTAKVNQLRKKGVPIESARAARKRDDSVSPDATGYRLVAR